MVESQMFIKVLNNYFWTLKRIRKWNGLVSQL